ncbi:TonB-dependent receptor plug domain-containing protein, partial [Raoultella sp. 18093]|uniref:TonB-dependent receptor plug domain-containing protein n=1 Tax=Raoultella sp. 18093 TaxID=2681425 RepID=UPI001356A931
MTLHTLACSLRSNRAGRPVRAALHPLACAVLLLASGAQAQTAATDAAAAARVRLPEVTVTGNPLGADAVVVPAAQLSGDDLTLRTESTLGQTLDGLPGVSSTYFGPNASRPIIRGLDGDRIRVLQN